ncbi:MAG TPA: hypothetical protein ENN68_04065 [Methanomicrobia archaeon]|nr:hypothetical protein [Methanomicrobia archaeon]
MDKEEHRKFLEDLEWKRKHHSELLEKYPDMWVAIVDKKVVSAGKDLGKVESEAEKKTGIERKKIPVSFVESGAHIYDQIIL